MRHKNVSDENKLIRSARIIYSFSGWWSWSCILCKYNPALQKLYCKGKNISVSNIQIGILVRKAKNNNNVPDINTTVTTVLMSNNACLFELSNQCMIYRFGVWLSKYSKYWRVRSWNFMSGGRGENWENLSLNNSKCDLLQTSVEAHRVQSSSVMCICCVVGKLSLS